MPQNYLSKVIRCRADYVTLGTSPHQRWEGGHVKENVTMNTP